jgi:hypothetical protein
VSTPSIPDPGSPPQTGSSPANKSSSSPVASASESGVDRLKVIGGLLALSGGLVALVVVVIVALIVKPDTTGGSIATAAIGVIGSTVGAYFGVKIGSDGTQKAIDAQQQEATKAQVFALHTAPEAAADAMANAQALISAQRAARQ